MAKQRQRGLLAGALGMCVAAALLFGVWRVDPSLERAEEVDPVANRSDGQADAAPLAIARMARVIVDAGAEVELSHRQLVEAIEDANADAYRALVDAVPELGG